MKGQGHFHFARALLLQNLKVYRKLLKGHQGNGGNGLCVIPGLVCMKQGQISCFRSQEVL